MYAIVLVYFGTSRTWACILNIFIQSCSGTTSTNHAALMQALLKGLAVLYMHQSQCHSTFFILKMLYTHTEYRRGSLHTILSGANYLALTITYRL